MNDGMLMNKEIFCYIILFYLIRVDLCFVLYNFLLLSRIQGPQPKLEK